MDINVEEIEKNYFQFQISNYSPISSLLAEQCKGIVLYKNEKNNFNLACLPFYRFTKYENEKNLSIDLDSVKIYEKKHGFNVNLYYHNNEWKTSMIFGNNI